MSDAVRRPRVTGARERLVRAALELFVERDYADVPTEEILARAGVSRGALYHHFPGKLDLFRAVYEETEERNIARIGGAAAAAATTPLAGLEAAVRFYLQESATNPELQRIGLIQSRAVLGWEGWAEAAQRLGIAAWEAGIRAAIESGELRDADVRVTAHILVAVLVEGGLLIATAPPEQRTAVRERVEPVTLAVLAGLRR